MSLIGSLEDLGLADILQIINLSQKSGLLIICSGAGEGRIIFRDGLVRTASVKGGPEDLRSLLVGGGSVSEADYDAALGESTQNGGEIETALERRGAIEREHLERLRRECVEGAVLKMLAWQTGEFGFDVVRDSPESDPSLFLPVGINAQYLAMEGLRIDDESENAEVPTEGDPLADLFGADEEPAAEALKQTVRDAIRVASEPPNGADDDIAPGVAGAHQAADANQAADAHQAADANQAADAHQAADANQAADAHQAADANQTADAHQAADTTEAEQPAPVEPRETAAVGGLGPTAPVVVIDDDLRGLEWVKGALSSSFQRVHIFQRSELGLTRIRQYLARIETPLVLVSPAIAGDPLSGIRDSADFVRRLKIQSPRMPVFWLCEEGVEPPRKGSADGAVTRPAAQKLRDQSAAPELAEALRRTLSG